MPDTSLSPSPSARELRGFALTVGTAFLALAAVGYWRGREAAPAVAGALGATLVVAGVLAPARLGLAYRVWMGLAHAISRVTTPLFMSAVYLAVLTPLGIAMRLAGRRPLSRRRDAKTFWVDRRPGDRRSDLRRQF